MRPPLGLLSTTPARGDTTSMVPGAASVKLMGSGQIQYLSAYVSPYTGYIVF